MLVKLDENLGRSHVALLRESGYAAERVHDEGLSGESDSVVWDRVCAEKRFFITIDLPFADVRRYTPGSHKASFSYVRAIGAGPLYRAYCGEF